MNYLTLLLLAILLPMGFYWHPIPAEFGTSLAGGLTADFLREAFNNYPALSVFFKSLLIYIQAVYFNKICSSVGLFERHSLLPATVFIICASYLSVFFSFHPILIGFFFFLIAFDQLIHVKQAEERFAQNLFYAAFSIGVASMFFSGYLFFILWILLLLPSIGALMVRHVFLTLSALIMPYFFTGVWYFARGTFSDYAANLTAAFPMSTGINIDFHHALWIPIVFFVLGLISYLGGGSKLLKETRTGFWIFLTAIIPCLLQFLLTGASLHTAFYLFMPVFAVFIVYFFYDSRGKLRYQVLFFLYLAGAFILPWAFYVSALLQEWFAQLRFW